VREFERLRTDLGLEGAVCAQGLDLQGPLAGRVEAETAVGTQDQADAIVQCIGQVVCELDPDIAVAKGNRETALFGADQVGRGVAHELIGHEAVACGLDHQHWFVGVGDGHEG